MAKTLSSCFLQEPACTTHRFSHLHDSNRPPCTSCGSHKRQSSAILPETKPKKPNNGTHPHFLRRRRYIPTLPPVLEEPPLSPQPIDCDPMSSSDTEWLRKMRDYMREMIRKCDEILGDENGSANEETKNNGNSSVVNNLIEKDDTMDNSGDEYVETVSVEKKGEALILHFKCPCCSGYQIILFGGNCYYKLM